MSAATPRLPAAAVNYPQSEREILGGSAEEKRSKKLPDAELLQLLRGYFKEAKEAREGGTDARDENWLANWNAYWSRYDTSQKAEWQAAEQMPEVGNFVDRLTAVLSLALVSQHDWQQITDPTDPTKKRGEIMSKFVRLILNHCAVNQNGQRIGFDATFSSAVKSGAMSMIAASVTFDEASGFVNIEPVNAMEVYYDPAGRGLYRIRRTPIDYWQLDKMKDQVDSKGDKIYDAAAIGRLQAHVDGESKRDRETITGSSEPESAMSRRKPILLDEYLCAIIDREGHLVAENQLVVVANEREIIRGPEDNPNWHKKDWIVSCPMIEVPFAPYGKSYVEVFRPLAATFTETTNLILDGIFAENIAAHMIWGGAIADAGELAEGIHPGMTVQADPDWPPGKPFIERIGMGGVTPASIRVWEALKAELREAGRANELSLGQVPPKGDITATEIRGAEGGTAVLQMALAKEIDTRFLAPILELAMMTGLQHFDPASNPVLADELGPEMAEMLAHQRVNFSNTRFRFVAKPMTTVMERGRQLQSLLGLAQILGQSEVLAAAFQRSHSIPKFLDQLLIHFAIDRQALEKDEEELRAEATQGPIVPPVGGAEPTGPGARGGAPIPRTP